MARILFYERACSHYGSNLPLGTHLLWFRRAIFGTQHTQIRAIHIRMISQQNARHG